MALEAVQVGQGLLPELERASGTRIDRDLRHVRTAGDLFGALQRAPGGEADRGGGAMTFLVLRRALLALWNLPVEPATPLRDNGLPSPKRLARVLERETGLAMPEVSISMFAWLVAAGIVVCGLIAFVLDQPVAGVLIAIAALVPLKLDGGEYSSDWETLGALAGAVARLNAATISDAGVPDAEAPGWRAFAELLARHAFVGAAHAHPRQIGPETLLRFA